ncbi:hypothetical protein NDU88_001368 [Pleurodeles waltl]|uniref:Uncharacterized protein n=1 Tax=Pleurodeles waltl TaxID=8319 RepID=A0AAV7TIK3_PLEWA|nr:hypothetical protein NDU88_001368 [Pleurodeles waltl]
MRGPGLRRPMSLSVWQIMAGFHPDLPLPPAVRCLGSGWDRSCQASHQHRPMGLRPPTSSPSRSECPSNLCCGDWWLDLCRLPVVAPVHKAWAAGTGDRGAGFHTDLPLPLAVRCLGSGWVRSRQASHQHRPKGLRPPTSSPSRSVSKRSLLWGLVVGSVPPPRRGPGS